MTRETHRAELAAIPLFRWITVLAALTLLILPASALSVAKKKEIARTQFENAERLREALNGRPAKERKLRDYQQVVDAYRRVYYVAPTSSKADASVVAVAELLVEQGRAFKSDAALKNAIGQYEFLRREYPGSKYRVEALFTIAQIYKDDLDDAEKAKETLQEFLKRYPKSEQAGDARTALKEIDEAETQAAKAKDTPKPQPAQTVAQKSATAEAAENLTPKSLVTGIRHWSTPDYTRIAVDIEDEILYDSGRISNPDRIYFDLKNTRLTSVLKGKSFDVDDGYLRKIRIGQFAPGLTRVVLEVGDDVGDYSAFLLPNPFRLIIDIHGKEVKKMMAHTQDPKADSDTTKTPAKDIDEKSAAKKPVTTKTVAANKSAAITKNAPEKKADPDSEKAEIAEDKVEKSQVSVIVRNGVPTKIVDPDPVLEKPEPVTVAKADLPETSVKEEPPVRIRGKKRQAPEKLNVHTARPTTDGERSLIRALGLKIGKIVVDAGHGGHDTGTIGPNGLEEKTLVLDVALRLGKLLESRLGADVIYTRDDDTFIPLETRTAIANQQQADLFISVHANSSRDQAARGVETYYLNFTSSRDALEVAARENAVSEKSIHELQDLVKKIALKDKIEESREFAQDVQQSLHTGLAAKAPAIRNRGVKQAPFIVLIGANMPSILAEISFISNPSDERKLRSPEYRQKIAESLYRGVARYTSGLSGVKVAQKMETGD